MLNVAEAQVTGKGVNEKSESVDTLYNKELDMVTGFGTDSTITYTVPEDIKGAYDIYIEYGKSLYPYGSTQAGLVINGEKEYVLPAKIQGCNEEFSDLYSLGKFEMAKNVILKPGDKSGRKWNL